MNIDCEYCGATAGEKCTTATGNIAKAPHKIRVTESDLTTAAETGTGQEPRYIDLEMSDVPRGNMVVYVDETGFAELQFTEHMQFHINRATELGDGTALAAMEDAGALRTIFAAKLDNELRRHHMPGVRPPYNVWQNMAVEDLDSCLRVTVDLGQLPNHTDNELSELAWPLAASLANITDPGTFGSEYLFS